MNGSSSNADDTDEVVSCRIDELSEVKLLGVLDVLLTRKVEELLSVSFSR
jgi:hypothetical protein